MKNQNSKTADYSHVTPALIQSVEIVLNDVAKHRYSTSGIYNAHNAVFKLRETPESCTSCLTNRAGKLKQWYADYALAQADAGKDVYGNKIGEALPTAPAPVVPRETYTTLDDIYAAYSAEFGYDPDEPENGMSEAEAIAEITKQDAEATASGITMLFDSERELLGARLAELTESKSKTDATNADVNKGNTMTPITVIDKSGAEHKAVFTSKDGIKGTLLNSEGKAMKPGTYTTEGGSYAVQPGGNVTFKPGEESIL